MFNYQVCSFKGCPRRGRPPRSKPAGTLEPDQTLSGWMLASVCQHQSHPWIQAAMKHVCQDHARFCCACTAEHDSSLNVLEGPVRFPPTRRRAALDLYPRLGAPLLAAGAGGGGGGCFCADRFNSWKMRQLIAQGWRLSVQNVLREDWWSPLETDLCEARLSWRVVGLISWYFLNFLLEFGIDVYGALVFPAFPTIRSFQKHNCAVWWQEQ